MERANVKSAPLGAMNKKSVAVLISGRGSNMVALIEAAKAPDYPAEIILVVSNVPDAAGLARARADGIATAVIDHRTFGEDREAFERALDNELRTHRIEIVCLAGFMRLLTTWFVKQWSGRMLNIHPALLPQFKGLHTHRRALEAGAERHGATVTSSFLKWIQDQSSLRIQWLSPKTIPKMHSRRACSKSSTASIRKRYGWLLKAKRCWIRQTTAKPRPQSSRLRSLCRVLRERLSRTVLTRL